MQKINEPIKKTKKNIKIKFINKKITKLVAEGVILLMTFSYGSSLIKACKGESNMPNIKDYYSDSISKNTSLQNLVDRKIVGMKDCKDDTRQFCIVDCGNYSNQLNDKDKRSLKNYKTTPCGILINSKVTNRNELNKEITYINNILVDYEIDYPIFINIDTLLERKNIFSNINDLITDEKMTAYDIIDSFALNIAQNVVLYGSQTSFLELSDNYKTTPKAIKLEKDEKLIYDGNYNFVSCVIKNANIIENEVVFADNIYSNEGDLLLRINKLTDTEKAIIAKERPISIDGGKYYKGIDVSEFQGDINWETVDPKINYAIIRICDFSNIDDKKQVTIDKKFEYNINECKRLNIPFGIYAVTNAKTTKEAQIEASKIVNTLKPIIKSDEISYPIYLDVEGKDYEQLLKSDPNLVKSVCSTWCETIRNQGYEVGIYSQISILQELKTLNQFYPFWVARYHNDLEIAYDDIKPNDTTDSFKEDSINQVTRKCTIDGIKGPVDVNLTSPTLFNNMLSNPKNYIKSK